MSGSVSWCASRRRRKSLPRCAVAGQIDVTELADQVRIPTLVLHATGDAFSPFDQGREIASRISGSRFVPLESRKHVLLEEEPACSRFLQEVRGFLQEGEA